MGRLRAALYARVSREEQTKGYSLDAQSRAFLRFCERKDWEVYFEYVEAGRSAHTEDMRKRPVFKQAIEDALAGKYDVLVVHKIDRFSRKLMITQEYFTKLGRAGVGFVSIENDMDYSTPQGKFMLTMQGGLAELFSDILGEEVKKGIDERREQGMYVGPLPFGVRKGEDGIAEADPQTHRGLILAFELGAQGKSDREVAQALNSRGYRTVGTRGGKPFGNHTVRWIFNNRFYLGYLPDGKGGWLEGKHEAMITEDLWEQVQAVRRRNRPSTHSRTPSTKRVWSLTGLTYCWHCKGRMHVRHTYKGRPRLGCYNRAKGWDCAQPASVYLSIFEEQVLEYLRTFHIPEDYQEQLLEAHRKLRDAYDDIEAQRRVLQARLVRSKELYEWGDYPRETYLVRRDEIMRELDALPEQDHDEGELERLAKFLGDVPAAWEAASPEQRNSLARCLFDEVWIKDREVVAVRPRRELDPFFRLNYQEFMKKVCEDRIRTRVELYREQQVDIMLAVVCAGTKNFTDLLYDGGTKVSMGALTRRRQFSITRSDLATSIQSP